MCIGVDERKEILKAGPNWHLKLKISKIRNLLCILGINCSHSSIVWARRINISTILEKKHLFVLSITLPSSPKKFRTNCRNNLMEKARIRPGKILIMSPMTNSKALIINLDKV